MDLRQRLRRIERPAAASAAQPQGPDAELRRRLDRLLGTGLVQRAADLPPKPSRRAPRRLEELVPGRRVGAGSREIFVSEVRYAAQGRHGRVPVAALAEFHRSPAARLFDRHLGAVDRPESVAFLDTETTGLAGGAGTVPFLVGVARWTGTAFRVLQLFLEDLDREPALLDALAEELQGVECLVTYNGRTFDIPLLENRHILNRRPWPLSGARHLDLLPASRSLWRRLHSDCRLTTLERGVLGYVREGDVPGAEIPAIYSRYLRSGPDRALAAVFEHNRLDLLSLAGLLWAAGEEAQSPAGAAALGVGNLHAREGRTEDARGALEAALQGELAPGLRARALRELSLACKAAGEWERALELWEELRGLAPGGDPFAVEEAAKALERRLGKPAAALALVEEALARGLWSWEDRRALERRRERLCRKCP